MLLKYKLNIKIKRKNFSEMNKEQKRLHTVDI